MSKCNDTMELRKNVQSKVRADVSADGKVRWKKKTPITPMVPTCFARRIGVIPPINSPYRLSHYNSIL